MPLVRIDVSRNIPAKHVQSICDVVYNAMITVANVPLDDKFHIISRHSADELVYPENGYLGIRYASDITFVQVT